MTSTVNAKNELTTEGTLTLAFDYDGNTTTDDQGHTLVWNAWNELVAVKNGGTTLASYAYDGEGRLITTTVSGSATDTYFIGEQDIETRTGVTSLSNGTLGTVNIFSPDYVNDILLRDTYSSGTFSQRVYFTHNAHFDMTAVISSSGTVLQRQVYSAYGTVTFLSASWVPGSDGYSLTHLWQGGKRDATTGMYLFEARWYSPSMERWVSADPIGYDDGMNDFLGLHANPINRKDPHGTDDEALPAELIGEEAAVGEAVSTGSLSGVTNALNGAFPWLDAGTIRVAANYLLAGGAVSAVFWDLWNSIPIPNPNSAPVTPPIIPPAKPPTINYYGPTPPSGGGGGGRGIPPWLKWGLAGAAGLGALLLSQRKAGGDGNLGGGPGGSSGPGGSGSGGGGSVPSGGTTAAPGGAGPNGPSGGGFGGNAGGAAAPGALFPPPYNGNDPDLNDTSNNDPWSLWSELPDGTYINGSDYPLLIIITPDGVVHEGEGYVSDIIDNPNDVVEGP